MKFKIIEDKRILKAMERNKGIDEDKVMGCVPPRWIFSAIRNESIFTESEV